jgi:hypothetical protein
MTATVKTDRQTPAATISEQEQIFSAQTFEFRCEVVQPIRLNQHKGSALRGALFNSLRTAGCSHRELTSCHPCPLVADCPVSFLLATVATESKRGSDVPRPFVINPPLDDSNVLQVGEKLNFELTLFARSVRFLPYLIVAMQYIEREGLGVHTEATVGSWRRGAIRVYEIVARNVLSGEEQVIFKVGRPFLDVPENPVTHSQILQLMEPVEPNGFRLLHFTFHTPTHLVAKGKALTRPDFPVLMQRLIERVSSLSLQYGQAELDLDFEALMEEAQQVLLVQDRTRWESVRSYSQRQGRDISLGGFLGEVTFVGRVDKLLPLLLWGQLTHVGKDATKGNGWYSLRLDTPLGIEC